MAAAFITIISGITTTITTATIATTTSTSSGGGGGQQQQQKQQQRCLVRALHYDTAQAPLPHTAAGIITRAHTVSAVFFELFPIRI